LNVPSTANLHKLDIGSSSQYLRWTGGALKIKGNLVAVDGTFNTLTATSTGDYSIRTDVTKLGNDGLTIASYGDPTATSNVPISEGGIGTDTNYLIFAWDDDSVTQARDGTSSGSGPHIALGGYYRTISDLNAPVSGTPYASNIFQFIWYHAGSMPASTLQYHDMNRGIIGNLTAIGPGNAAHSTHFRPPSNVTTTADADNGLVLALQTDQGTNTGYADKPWGTEWVAAGTVTSVTVVGDGLAISNATTTPNITLDLSEFTDMTAAVVGTSDELILLDNGLERRKLISEITLSDFNNDSGWTSNTGDITSVIAGDGMNGGGYSGALTITLASPDTLTSVTTNATSGTGHTHAVTGLGGVDDTAIVKRGTYTGNGEPLTGKTIVTGLTTISHITFYEYKTIGTDVNNNRRSDAGKVFVAFNSTMDFGNVFANNSANTTYRAVFRSYDEKWYGGRCLISGGTVIVYEEGTGNDDGYFDQGSMSANVNLTSYHWVAVGE